MKSLMTLILLIGSAATSAKIITVEQVVDFSMLYKKFTPVDYRDYNLPEELAQEFTTRTTYSIPDNMVSSIKKENYPAGKICEGDWGWFSCQDYSAGQENIVEFRQKDFFIKWEIINVQTGQLVQQKKGKLRLSFRSGVPAHRALPGSGSASIIHIEIPKAEGTINNEFDLGNNISYLQNRKSAHVMLEDISFNISYDYLNNYARLEFNFDNLDLTRKHYSSSGLLDIDRERYGFYHKVGSRETGNDIGVLRIATP